MAYEHLLHFRLNRYAMRFVFALGKIFADASWSSAHGETRRVLIDVYFIRGEGVGCWSKLLAATAIKAARTYTLGHTYSENHAIPE